MKNGAKQNYSNLLKEQHRVKQYSHKGEICGRTCLTTRANATHYTAQPFTQMVLVEGMPALADEFSSHKISLEASMICRQTRACTTEAFHPHLHRIARAWCLQHLMSTHRGNRQIAPSCKYYLNNKLVADFTFCESSKCLFFNIQQEWNSRIEINQTDLKLTSHGCHV